MGDGDKIMPRSSKYFHQAKDEMSKIPELEYIDPELATFILKGIPSNQYNNGQVINTLKFVLLALLQDGFAEMDKNGESKLDPSKMKTYDNSTLEDLK
jgi:hypothetical protein